MKLSYPSLQNLHMPKQAVYFATPWVAINETSDRGEGIKGSREGSGYA